MKYDAVSAEWFPTFRMHRVTSTRQEPLTHRHDLMSQTTWLLTKKSKNLKVLKSLCLGADSCAARYSFVLPFYTCSNQRQSRNLLGPLLHPATLYTSERVSLSLVLRVARCHGGW